MRCSDFHGFYNADPDATGADPTGYGSRAWLTWIISGPAHASFYGRRKDWLPVFAADRILGDRSIGLRADWIQGAGYWAPH